MASAVIAAVIVWPCSKRVELEQRAAGAAGHERHDHRLADRAREGEQQRGHDAGDRGGEDDVQARRSLARAQAVRRLAQVLRHRVHARPRRSVATSGVMRTPTARPATNMFESGAPVEWLHDRRAEPGEGQEPEHHARDGGEDLDDRLDRSCGPACDGVLAEVDPRTQAERRRHEHRDAGDDERPRQDRRDVVHAAPREPAVGEEPTLSTWKKKVAALPISEKTIAALITIEKTAAPRKASRISGLAAPSTGAMRRSPSSRLPAALERSCHHGSGEGSSIGGTRRPSQWWLGLLRRVRPDQRPSQAAWVSSRRGLVERRRSRPPRRRRCPRRRGSQSTNATTAGFSSAWAVFT